MPQKKTVITTDDILGKDAVDTEGDILGIVMKVHIDKYEKKLVGITIDQGFMKPDLFIGMNYIRNFGVDAVFLNKVPVDKFMGIDVITAEGKVIGTVKNINAKRHKIEEIIITKKGITHGGKYSIPSSSIDQIGESIVLKKAYKIMKIDA